MSWLHVIELVFLTYPNVRAFSKSFASAMREFGKTTDINDPGRAADESSALWILKDHHRSSVIDNRDITPAQIQSDERLRFNNNISYIQAYRVKCLHNRDESCFLDYCMKRGGGVYIHW